MMSNSNKINGWDFIRQVLTFFFGISLIIYTIVATGPDATLLIIGMTMMGVVSIDRYLTGPR